MNWDIGKPGINPRYTSKYPEITIFAPTCAPTIFNNPIIHPITNTITYCCYRMPTQQDLAGGVVSASGIGEKILINFHPHLNRTPFHQRPF